MKNNQELAASIQNSKKELGGLKTSTIESKETNSTIISKNICITISQYSNV